MNDARGLYAAPPALGLSGYMVVLLAPFILRAAAPPPEE